MAVSDLRTQIRDARRDFLRQTLDHGRTSARFPQIPRTRILDAHFTFFSSFFLLFLFLPFSFCFLIFLCLPIFPPFFFLPLSLSFFYLLFPSSAFFFFLFLFLPFSLLRPFTSLFVLFCFLFFSVSFSSFLFLPFSQSFVFLLCFLCLSFSTREGGRARDSPNGRLRTFSRAHDPLAWPVCDADHAPISRRTWRPAR